MNDFLLGFLIGDSLRSKDRCGYSDGENTPDETSDKVESFINIFVCGLLFLILFWLSDSIIFKIIWGVLSAILLLYVVVLLIKGVFLLLRGVISLFRDILNAFR